MKPGYNFDPAAALAHLQASEGELAVLIARIGPFALELKAADSLFGHASWNTSPSIVVSTSMRLGGIPL